MEAMIERGKYRSIKVSRTDFAVPDSDPSLIRSLAGIRVGMLYASNVFNVAVPLCLPMSMQFRKYVGRQMTGCRLITSTGQMGLRRWQMLAFAGSVQIELSGR